MLTITILGEESYDESKNEFVYPDSFEVQLEHSLAVLSKWEQKHEKPFLGKDEKSKEELLDYVGMMIQSDHGPEVIAFFTQENFDQIGAYMNAKMTATWFNELPGQKKNHEVYTADLIYYWMSALQIPLEFENRHLNQLFTIIRVHSAKNQPEKKMGKAEAARQRRELNAQRRAQRGSKG